MTDLIIFIILWVLGWPMAASLVMSESIHSNLKVKHVPTILFLSIIPLFGVFTIFAIIFWIFWKIAEKFKVLFPRVSNFLNKDLIKW